MKKKITLRSIIRFITGYSRLYRYIFTQKLLKKYGNEVSLLPEYKKEQFEERLILADQKCLIDGKCKMCGCATPALFFIEDSCEGGCYPKMQNREEWENRFS